MKLVPITFAVAFLLAGCGSTTPTSPPPSPAGSHVARVDTSAPVVNGVQAPPSSGDPAPSESAAPQPTPTPDPDPVRTAAAAGYLAVVQVLDAPSEPITICRSKPDSLACERANKRVNAQGWVQFAAALKQLQVPADTAADLRHLIRRVAKRQALAIKESVAGSWPVMWRLKAADNDSSSWYGAAANQVRRDLHLPLPGFHCWPNCPIG